MTIYTIDFNRGLDTNDGITAPWQNLSKLSGAFNAGDEIVLADDSEWNLSPLVSNNVTMTADGTEAAPIIVRRAGNLSSRPLIKRNYSIPPGDWIWDAGAAAWYFDATPVLGVQSLQVNDLLLLGGSELYAQRRKTLPEVLGDGHWFNVKETKRLYVYAPAGLNPTDYYGGILYSGAAMQCMLLSNARWVEVRGISANRTGGLVSNYSSGAPSDYRVSVLDCKAFRMGGMVRSYGEHTTGDIELRVEGCSSEETMSLVVQAFTTMADQSGLRLIARHNRFDKANMGSSAAGAIYLQSYARSGLWNLVEENDISGTGFAIENKIDGCAIYCETGSRNTLVRRNIIRDQYLALQDNSGYATRWEHNAAIGCNALISIVDGGANGSGNATVVNNTQIDAASIYNTSTLNIGSPMYISNAVTATFKNNLFVSALPEAQGLPILVFGSSLPTVTEANNAVNGYGSATFASKPTATALTNPVTGDLKLTAAGIPMPGSPLLTQGADLGLRRDIRSYQGRKFIGAYGPARLVAE
jgi:hypothetical protein